MSVCGWCGFDLGTSQPWACPSCGNDPGNAPAPVDSSPIERTTDDRVPRPTRRCVDPKCDGPLAPGASTCALCGADQPADGSGSAPPAAVRAEADVATGHPQTVIETVSAVRFPWGSVPLPAEGLDLGREIGPQSVRDHLAGYPNISRRHARISPAGRNWVVSDLGSTNGTFVDGRRLADGEAAPTRPGTRVRLAAGLEMTMEASC